MTKKLTAQDDAARAAKRERVDAQADEFARLLEVDPEDVMIDSHGVSLTPAQADVVLGWLKESVALGTLVEMVCQLTHGGPRPAITNRDEAQAWVLAQLGR